MRASRPRTAFWLCEENEEPLPSSPPARRLLHKVLARSLLSARPNFKRASPCALLLDASSGRRSLGLRFVNSYAPFQPFLGDKLTPVGRYGLCTMRFKPIGTCSMIETAPIMANYSRYHRRGVSCVAWVRLEGYSRDYCPRRRLARHIRLRANPNQRLRDEHDLGPTI